MTEITLHKRTNELVAKYGTLRKAGKALGLSAAYICRIRAGEHGQLSEETLIKLGVRRMPDIYVRSGK